MSVVEWAARVINTLAIGALIAYAGAYVLCGLKLLADVVWRRAVAAYDRWDDQRWERKFTTRTGLHRSRWQP